MKITATIRSAVRAVIADSRQYDAETVRIGRDGSVSALKDADKTFAGNDPVRYLIGHVTELVDAAGGRREGW